MGSLLQWVEEINRQWEAKQLASAAKWWEKEEKDKQKAEQVQAKSQQQQDWNATNLKTMIKWF